MYTQLEVDNLKMNAAKIPSFIFDSACLSFDDQYIPEQNRDSYMFLLDPGHNILNQ